MYSPELSEACLMFWPKGHSTSFFPGAHILCQVSSNSFSPQAFISLLKISRGGGTRSKGLRGIPLQYTGISTQEFGNDLR